MNRQERIPKSEKKQMPAERQRKREEREKRRELQREQTKRKAVGVDFEQSSLEGMQDTETLSYDDNNQNVHEIHIEGIDDFTSDITEQDDTIYIYEDNTRVGKNPKTTQHADVKSKSSEHAADGEFTPKERVTVSEEAKKAMNRKPFSAGAEELMQENSAEEPVRKASSEGKIIAPEKKKLKYKKPSYSLLKDSSTNSGKMTRGNADGNGK